MSIVYLIELIIVAIVIFKIIKRILIHPSLSLYKKCSLWIKFRILFFEKKCEFCKQIACRGESGVCVVYHCLNDICMDKASRPNRGWSSANFPLDGSLGWKLNKEAKR